MRLNINNIIAFVACIFFLFIIGKIFIVPIKLILKLCLNSLLGALFIFIINIIGSIWNFHIGINVVTSVFIGLLGIPGALAVILIKILIE